MHNNQYYQSNHYYKEVVDSTTL